jgi:hypothetical protein
VCEADVMNIVQQEVAGNENSGGDRGSGSEFFHGKKYSVEKFKIFDLNNSE